MYGFILLISSNTQTHPVFSRALEPNPCSDRPTGISGKIQIGWLTAGPHTFSQLTNFQMEANLFYFIHIKTESYVNFTEMYDK